MSSVFDFLRAYYGWLCAVAFLTIVIFIVVRVRRPRKKKPGKLGKSLERILNPPRRHDGR